MSIKQNEKKMFELGLKLCDSGINLQNQLIEILKIVNKPLKNSKSNKADIKDLDKISMFTKTIIMSIILADEQIKRGIELCRLEIEDKNSF